MEEGGIWRDNGIGDREGSEGGENLEGGTGVREGGIGGNLQKEKRNFSNFFFLLDYLISL